MSKLIKVEQKRLVDQLDNIGKTIHYNMYEIATIQNQIKILNAKKKQFEDENIELLSKAETKIYNEYENLECGVTTDSYEFPINKGNAVSFDEEKLNIDKVPEKYISKSLSKSAVKNEWAANNFNVPQELKKLGITVEETRTISCKRINKLSAIDKMKNIRS